MQTALQKLAIDASAAEYWSKYFGAYGKQWVRKIPHRVAHALIARSAELASAEHATQISVQHIGHALTKDAMHLEGTFRYTAGEQAVSRLFRASFTHDGELQSIDSLPI